MKINKFLKTGLATVAAVLFAGNVLAQLPNTPTPVTDAYYTQFINGTRESIDSVTVNSKMAYKLSGDPAIAAIPPTILNPSYFKWDFNGGMVSIYKTDDSEATPANGVYYDNLKEVYVIMPTTAGTTLSLTVNEKTRPVINPDNGCEGTDSTVTIRVLPKPKFEWPVTKQIGNCFGSVTDVDIVATLSGNGQWEITYDIIYYTRFDKSDAVPTTTSSQRITVGSSGNKTGQYTIPLPATIFTAVGVYDIKVTNITDRISRKSLDMKRVASVAGTDVPAANDLFSVYTYPLPNTKKLQHVKNL